MEFFRRQVIIREVSTAHSPTLQLPLFQKQLTAEKLLVLRHFKRQRERHHSMFGERMEPVKAVNHYDKTILFAGMETFPLYYHHYHYYEKNSLSFCCDIRFNFIFRLRC
jgi:hypothetical protein